VTHHAAESEGRRRLHGPGATPRTQEYSHECGGPKGVAGVACRRRQPALTRTQRQRGQSGRPIARGQSHTIITTTPAKRSPEKIESWMATRSSVTSVAGRRTRLTQPVPRHHVEVRRCRRSAAGLSVRFVTRRGPELGSRSSPTRPATPPDRDHRSVRQWEFVPGAMAVPSGPTWRPDRCSVRVPDTTRFVFPA